MTAGSDDGDDEYEECGYDVDEMLNGDHFGPDFPELPDECRAAAERSLVRFMTSNLCGMIADEGKIVTHYEAIREEVERASEAEGIPSFEVEVNGRNIFCSLDSMCDCCGFVRLGPPLDRTPAEVEQHKLVVTGVAARPFRRFDHTEAFPVFILDPHRNWIRGWRIGRDCVHELLVESTLKPSDVGCPVVDEDGDIVRVVETTDVYNWINPR